MFKNRECYEIQLNEKLFPYKILLYIMHFQCNCNEQKCVKNACNAFIQLRNLWLLVMIQNNYEGHLLIEKCCPPELVVQWICIYIYVFPNNNICNLLWVVWNEMRKGCMRFFREGPYRIVERESDAYTLTPCSLETHGAKIRYCSALPLLMPFCYKTPVAPFTNIS